MSEWKKKYHCDVIRDLLPLYHDGVCSDVSKAMVEEHLEECGDCRAIAAQLKNTSIDTILTEETEHILQTHARREKRTAMQAGIITAGVLMIPVVVCLICNLAIGHGLDWFFIVLTSLLLVASFTVVPLMTAERKLFYAILSGTASLILLLLACCIYSQGDWFFLVAIPTLLGLSVVLAPYMICQIPFEKYPIPLQTLFCHKGLLVMVWDTIWLYATIVVCGLHSTDSAYWNIALPVTTVCVLIPWGIFIIIRYLKIPAAAKAGCICMLAGFFSLFGNDFCSYFIEGHWDFRISHMDFVTWRWTEPMSDAAMLAYNANINGLVGILLLAAGSLLFLIRLRKSTGSTAAGNKFGRFLLHTMEAVLLFLLANFPSVAAMGGSYYWLLALAPLFVLINIFPSVFHFKLQTGKLRNSADGCLLLRLFLWTTGASILYSLIGWFGGLPLEPLTKAPGMWAVNSLMIFLSELILFWNGIIRIYITSEQLGIRWRVIGAVCGMIPIVHLVVLGILISTVEKEVRTENEKLLVNKARAQERFCYTKYPILLVHGVFFRDSNYFNYWGRIPKELEKNGAVIFYGNHQSAASTADSGKELAERIRQIVRENHCEKVNIIAHSKGGLDCRYAIAKLQAAPYVASLTTINTPHRGCEFADYLLTRIPEKQQHMVAKTYNAALKKFGDNNPDFLAAVYDLTASSCRAFNEQVPDVPEVYYQSVGSKLNVASCGRFPLNFSYHLVNRFDGNNDGLVGENSFSWGEDYQFLTVKGKRGISHGDMIDLNRENFDGFDVREFYVQLVHRLKEKGY